jgi:hypothetical protein
MHAPTTRVGLRMRCSRVVCVLPGADSGGGSLAEPGDAESFSSNQGSFELGMEAPRGRACNQGRDEIAVGVSSEIRVPRAGTESRSQL